jgi:hypothetical protein
MDYTGSILFLGSGFSAGAVNIQNTQLPTGSGLKKHFLDLLKMRQSDYDLRVLADVVAKDPNLDLYNELYKLFTVKFLKPYQSDILSRPWKRIYTTNYDDVAELARHKAGLNLSFFDYDDPKPNKIPEGSIIHLHGSIRKTTSRNALTQLVLNENSYIKQHFERSEWYDEFTKDLRYCNGCYFIGYALNDYHLSALLLENPETVAKTYFITHQDPDKIFTDRITPYGFILPIGAEQFSKLYCTLPQQPKLLDTYKLKNFLHLNPHKDNKSASSPTPIEVLNLLTYGHFNVQRCFSSLPKSSYVISRNNQIANALTELEKAKCLMVHSRLGNGKSIFLHILASKLIEKGFNCYMCAPNPSPEHLLFDVTKLNTSPKNAIFFDSYNAAVSVMSLYDNFSSDTKFIVAMRTGIQEVRMHEVSVKMPKPLASTSLNVLTEDDKAGFRSLFNHVGINHQASDDIITRAKDFRDIITTLYNNHIIKTSIIEHLSHISANDNLRHLLISSHLLKWIGHDPDPNFLKKLSGCDIYLEFHQNREILSELFQIDDTGIFVRSSLLSEYIISNHLKAQEIIDSIYTILTETISYKKDRNYNPIINQLMRFTNLRLILKNDTEHLVLIEKLYDRLHRDIEINKEPLFWLQYSILMAELDNLSAAEHFLTTAYSRALDLPDFKTYQIDTHALRLLPMIEQKEVGNISPTRLDLIFDVLNKTASMLAEESHRDFAIRALVNIHPFITTRFTAMSSQEIAGLHALLTIIRDVLDKLKSTSRFSAELETANLSIHRSVNFLSENLTRSSPTS